MDDFGDHIHTDFGSINELLRVYAIAKGIPDKSVMSIGLADPPNDYLTTDNYAGQSVVIPKAGAFQYNDIHKFVRAQLVDGYIAKENAPILLLNGTSTVGLATKRSEELKSYSYNIVKIDNAPTQDYAHTVIVDLSGNNKYTRNYLEKRFKVTATSQVPAGITVPPEQQNKGFVIIIGRDEAATR
jgi:hypothetical protein